MFRWLMIYSAAAIVLANGQKNPNYVGNRTVMVHLFEWKWNDIADECERFLGPMGYAGVQVSPIQENVIVAGRPWWERYQPVSYRFETRSGSEAEFRSMLRRCNDAGVRVYADMLLNHMSANHENAKGTGDSRAEPSRLEYPAVPYEPSHFHPICEINDYQDAYNVRNCELVGLHDLDQSQEHVRERIVDMLDRLVDAGVAGFRVDAAKHMWPQDLAEMYSRVHDLNTEHGFVPGSRPYFCQEVIDYGNEASSRYDYNRFGAVMEFRYGTEVSNALRGRNQLKWFRNWGEPWDLLPSSDALVFIDNHDTQRSSGDVPITYKSSKEYKMAIAFMLAHPYGTPRIMSSFNFDNFDQGPPSDGLGNIVSPTINPDNTCDNGWVCEHRWRQISNMAAFRNKVGDSPLTSWWDNDNYQIAFCRGDRGFIAINSEFGGDLRRTLHVCVPPGGYCDVITGGVANGGCTGKVVWVDENRNAYIKILGNENDGVLAIHTGAKFA